MFSAQIISASVSIVSSIARQWAPDNIPQTEEFLRLSESRNIQHVVDFMGRNWPETVVLLRDVRTLPAAGGDD